ncbi:hypothetical protein JHK87_050088 [Glycine soja]|nr:hypothetical protein JHK87_050088 [Glycine soja]
MFLKSIDAFDVANRNIGYYLNLIDQIVEEVGEEYVVVQVVTDNEKVLILVDGDEKPTMGFVYEAMDRAKQAIEKNCRYHTH